MPSQREVELEIEVRLLKEQINLLIQQLASRPPQSPAREETKNLVDRNANKDWSNVMKKCPRCGKTKQVDVDFGIKKIRGTTYPQSWCLSCRNSNPYYVPVSDRDTTGSEPSAKRPVRANAILESLRRATSTAVERSTASTSYVGFFIVERATHPTPALRR
jgi:hypothetical protein